MLTIELIESKIKIMNPDGFHRLCDHYLFVEGEDEYDSIVPVGQVEGKQKAKKGTPDTRIRKTDGSYIFIQYTTQEQYPNPDALLKKLLEDLNNCFNPRKTKVSMDNLGLVVLCFNSNIGNAAEEKLRDMAWAKGKRLELINLSTLAHKIIKDYPFLAKEHLGIEIDTLQLLPIKKFIEEYERGAIATPISNPFLFDPEAERAESMTTYQYAGNSPVLLNDPLGNLQVNPTDYPDYYKPLGLSALPQGGGGDMFANADAIENSIAEMQAWANSVYEAEAAATLSFNLNALWASDNGGHGDEDGITFFDSPYTAMKAGYADLKASGLAGSSLLPGSALSFDQALLNYDTNPAVTGPGYTVAGNTYGVNRANFDLLSPIRGHTFAYNPVDPSNGNAIPDLDGNDGNGTLEGPVIYGNKKEGGENLVNQQLETLDHALTLATSPGLLSKMYKLATESEALHWASKFTGVATIINSGYDGIKDYQNGHWVSGTWNFAKAAGQGVILWGGGEEMELLWNTGTLATDGLIKLFKKE